MTTINQALDLSSAQARKYIENLGNNFYARLAPISDLAENMDHFAFNATDLQQVLAEVHKPTMKAKSSVLDHGPMQVNQGFKLLIQYLGMVMQMKVEAKKSDDATNFLQALGRKIIDLSSVEAQPSYTSSFGTILDRLERNLAKLIIKYKNMVQELIPEGLEFDIVSAVKKPGADGYYGLGGFTRFSSIQDDLAAKTPYALGRISYEHEKQIQVDNALDACLKPEPVRDFLNSKEEEWDNFARDKDDFEKEWEKYYQQDPKFLADVRPEVVEQVKSQNFTEFRARRDMERLREEGKEKL